MPDVSRQTSGDLTGALMECGCWWHAWSGAREGTTKVNCPWHAETVIKTVNVPKPTRYAGVNPDVNGRTWLYLHPGPIPQTLGQYLGPVGGAGGVTSVTTTLASAPTLNGVVPTPEPQKRALTAVRALYDEGITNENEDIRVWTREWGEQYRDLLELDDLDDYIAEQSKDPKFVAAVQRLR